MRLDVAFLVAVLIADVAAVPISAEGILERDTALLDPSRKPKLNSALDPSRKPKKPEKPKKPKKPKKPGPEPGSKEEKKAKAANKAKKSKTIQILTELFIALSSIISNFYIVTVPVPH
ncbi:hypothetical protein PT974_07309 [Cladobotryum mycophilum]|uniref:Uncharacterized protein n=1 Tax=Cladobotryum mycophilum TaxID=491253 RepID=A0ABR0SPQ0_9HYPO